MKVVVENPSPGWEIRQDARMQFVRHNVEKPEIFWEMLGVMEGRSVKWAVMCDGFSASIATGPMVSRSGKGRFGPAEVA